eukprot:733839-Pelagomonas_calceolata.AAC.6
MARNVGTVGTFLCASKALCPILDPRSEASKIPGIKGGTNVEEPYSACQLRMYCRYPMPST